MNYETIIVWTFLLGSLPLVLYSIKCIRDWGFGLWLLSPLPIFHFAFVISFVVVPLFEIIYNFKLYDFVHLSYNSFLLSEILAVLSCYAFVFGFASLPSLPLTRPTHAESVSEEEAIKIFRSVQAFQLAAYLACIFFQLLHLVFIAMAGALTPNLGANRHAYMQAFIGGGYINIINILGLTCLMVGFLFSLLTGRGKVLAIIATLSFLIPNIIVTNRGLVVELLFLALFISLAKRHKANQKIKTGRLVFGLLAVIIVGTYLGISRREDFSAEVSGPAFLAPVMFLSYTFDMSVMLRETIDRTEGYHYGSTWIEDVVYTYIPRAIFPSKPTIYGTVRLQTEVAPSLTPAGDQFASTFPIGVFGEGYANFGFIGVPLTLFMLGVILKYMYNYCLNLIVEKNLGTTQLFFILTYVALAGNPLGYLRSFGQFLAAIIADAINFGILLVFLSLLSQSILALCPERKENEGPLLD
jgi:oligosaccharide repeat unit polymerase